MVRYSPLREPVSKKPIKEFKPQPFRAKPKKMVDIIREERFVIDSVPGKLFTTFFTNEYDPYLVNITLGKFVNTYDQKMITYFLDLKMVKFLF